MSDTSTTRTQTSASDGGYQVGRPRGECALTGEAIEPGSSFVSTLCEIEVEREDGSVIRKLERFDISEKAWEDGARPERLVFYWRTRMPESNDEKPPFVDDEVLANLFDRLQDDEDDRRRAFRFVLGLILMRRKLLRCVGTEERGGQMFWLMRRKGETADMPAIEMIDPRLAEDQVRELTDQLGEIFREDF